MSKHPDHSNTEEKPNFNIQTDLYTTLALTLKIHAASILDDISEHL